MFNQNIVKMKFTKVLKMLKTNKDVASLGFNRKELRSLAQKIVDDSELGDDATDDDENTYISDSIEGMVPVLKIGQQYANRLASDDSSNGGKKPKKDEDDDEDDDDEEDEPKPRKSKSGKSKSNDGDDDGNDGEPSWFKSYRESMDKRFEKIESSRTGDTRKSKVEKILKDANVLDKPLGKRTLRDFGRMNFKNDEEFEEFLDEVSEDVEDIGGDGNGDAASAATPKDFTPPKGGKSGKKVDVASDQEIENLAGMF